MDRELIARVLDELLAGEPGLDKRQLLARLRERGFDKLTTTDVNSVLYERRSSFASDDATPPRWRLAHPVETATSARDVGPRPYRRPRHYIGPEPRAWQ